MNHPPKYPIYVPTKGRHERPLTIRALQALKVPFLAVVEPQESEDYAKIVGEENLLIVPHRDKGVVVTRNAIWEHAANRGVEKYWTFDDNIRRFYRLHKNKLYRIKTGSFLGIIEKFSDQYENLVVCGMQYESFVPRKNKHPPLIINTRVYSNMLIQTFACDSQGQPFRWEGFYNEDTDLCLRILKDGQCVAQLNAFLADKRTTMEEKGGNTGYYQGDGRWDMANELRLKHPDCVRIAKRWERWQHVVDYRPFRSNPLRLKDGVTPDESSNEFGLSLRTKGDADTESAAHATAQS